jgi:murein DD-endopeptidase MepM/ murein hydrolase activator NlpD
MSQQAAETSDAYTVVVFRGSSSKPLRFSFPRKFVRKLLILAAILVVADLLVISHYVIRTGEVWQLSAFRAEAMGAREQTAAFSAAIDDLKKRLSTMGEVNQRLRVMLGIDASKPAGDLANGRGGEDGPLAGREDECAGGWICHRLELEPRQQVSDARDANQSEVDFTTESIEEVTQQVRESLEALVREAKQQEEALESLTQVAEQRSTQWASTPSIWPVRGWVTSAFGPRVSPFTEKPAWHDGLDIGAQANSPVQAPALGRVDHGGV